MIRQVLTVIPHGIIESGQVVLQADEKTGLLDLSESLLVGWSIFSKTIQNAQELKIDPQILLSANIREGMKLQVGVVSIEIQSVMGNLAAAEISYSQGADHLSGLIDIDLSGQYWAVQHVLASGVIEGQSIELELKS